MKSLRFSLFVIVLLALCSCSKRDYVKVIPADATVVASVNLRSLSEKSDFANTALMQMIERVAIDSDVKEWQEYKDNPMATGIDFMQPMYVFFTQSGQYGVVVKVGDKGDLEDFFSVLSDEDMVSRPTEKKGMMCGTMGGLSYAFNDDALALFDGESNVLVRMLESEGESFVDTKAYDKMSEVDGKDIVIYTNLGYLPEMFQNEFQEYTQNSQLKMSDVELVASLDFVKGSAVMTAKWWGRTKKAQKVIDETKDCMRTIDGSYLDNLPDDLFMWIGTGMKGDKALERIKSNKQAKEALFMLERGVDVEQMIRSIDGDVSVAIPAYSLNSDEVDVAVWAKLKSTSFLDDVDDWKSSMADYGISMRNEGKDAYVLSLDGTEIHWGVEGKNLYYATPNAYQQMKADNARSSVLKDYEKEIKKSYYFVFLDLRKTLHDSGNLMLLNGITRNVGINLQNLKAIVLSSSAHDEIVLHIDMENDNENFLKQLLK